MEPDQTRPAQPTVVVTRPDGQRYVTSHHWPFSTAQHCSTLPVPFIVVASEQSTWTIGQTQLLEHMLEHNWTNTKPTATGPEPPPPHINQVGVGPNHPQIDAHPYGTIYMTDQETGTHSVSMTKMARSNRFKFSYDCTNIAFKVSVVVRVNTRMLCSRSSAVTN